MSKYRENYTGPFQANDVVIKYNDGIKDGIVLIERLNRPYGIALPGGFAEGWISYEQNSAKEGKEETGLELIIENPNHPLLVLSNPNRDIREHITSTSFVARGYGYLKPFKGEDARRAFNCSYDEVKYLMKTAKWAFEDHKDILTEFFNVYNILNPEKNPIELGDLPRTKQYNQVATIGKWKPIHKGHVMLLETLCEISDKALIGIGSSNIYDQRNPFTSKETIGMIDAVLSKKYNNYEFVEVPDNGNFKLWSENCARYFKGTDLFVSNNPLVKSLLEKYFSFSEWNNLIPKQWIIPVCGRMVKYNIANEKPLYNLVPAHAILYAEKNGLFERARKEFGKEWIAKYENDHDFRKEDAKEEAMHIIGGVQNGRKD